MSTGTPRVEGRQGQPVVGVVGVATISASRRSSASSSSGIREGMGPGRLLECQASRGGERVGHRHERHVVAGDEVAQVVAAHRAQAGQADAQAGLGSCGRPRRRTGVATSRTAAMTASSSSSARLGRTGIESTSSLRRSVTGSARSAAPGKYACR